MRIHCSSLTLLGGAALLIGCSDLPNVPTVPAIPHSAEAAVHAANQTVLSFDQALGDYTLATGLFTDELWVEDDPNNVALDRRQLAGTNVEKVSTTYQSLQSTRMAADVAVQGLIAYVPTSSDSLRARMYAIEGYTEVMLAEFFCSGIPLSRVDLPTGGVLYANGMSRDSVYDHAITLFDSTVALAVGNDSLVTLARIGKGRALLNMGRFAEAAQAVANVSTGSEYKVQVGFTGRLNPAQVNAVVTIAFQNDNGSDREGQVGHHYWTGSEDPRTYSRDARFPDKYFYPDSTVNNGGNKRTQYLPFVVADWIEARLIQAEAALHAGDPTTWLNTLNTLRTTALVALPNGAAPVPLSMSPLTDPGTAAARVDTMFADRAAWLYLTGHREGDLRRLIRQYGRTESQVYPNGVYRGGGVYGSDVVAPVPSSERQSNQFYTGCIDQQP